MGGGHKVWSVKKIKDKKRKRKEEGRKKRIFRAIKNVTAFLFMVNKPRWICGKRC